MRKGWIIAGSVVAGLGLVIGGFAFAVNRIAKSLSITLYED